MRIIKGLSALIALAVITVGIPAFLIATTGNPVPGLAEIPEALTRPDYGGEVLFGTIFPMLAWLGWAWLSIGILIEMVAAIAKIRIRCIGMFSPSQGLGSVLIGAVVAMGGAVGVIAPANAAPATSEVVQSQSVTTATVQGSSSSHTVKAEAPGGVKAVTVKAGDSLWNLAERHLGDGAKFKQIAELNYGKTQPGGGQLTHAHTLQPGWELTLPDTATLSPQTHTVAAGETLSSIAKDHLGDAEAYPHLLALNPSISDPDQISVGQTLRLPTETRMVAAKTSTAKQAAKPAEKTAPKADAGATDTAVSSAASAAADLAGSAKAESDHAAAEAAPAPVNTDPDQGEAEEASSATLRTIGGLGGILAAGLLALFARRRFNRRRNRKPGTPTPTTSAHAENVEARLKDVETLLTAADIDRTLRYLATWSQQHRQPLPELFCVRADENNPTLNLYLADPADLPTPFTKVTDDNTVWAITPAELPATTNTASAAYPALVTVGHDENKGQILLDLEHLTTLNITGPHERATATMNALAVELGVSPWAEDLTVSLVGFLEDLPAALGTGRIRHY
ncbi:MAG: LysM peptidoglycan-binding domain-containing protein, partial [Galactobacter sp.]